MKNTGYSKLIFLASAAILFAGCGGESSEDSSGHAEAQTATNYEAEVEQWHARRLERLQRDDGWLSLIGLHFLEEGENRIGTGENIQIQLPGEHPAYLGSIHLEEGRFRFVSAEGVEAMVAGDRVTEVKLTTDGEGTAEATLVQIGSLRFYVIQRGEDFYLRSKDSESEVRREFQGIDRYPVDVAWRVEANWVAFDEPTTIEIPNVLGTVESLEVSGRFVFEHDGTEYELLPTGDPDEGLFLVFGDAGNGVHSYGGGRFLYTDPPSEDGTVIVDFNLAYNPPCAFTPYATCPLPAEGNVLPFEVTAGEKSWGEEHH